MSYTTVEDALLAVVRSVTGYDTENSRVGDYRILGHGKGKAVILNPGPFRRINESSGVIRTDWAVNLELYVAYSGDISDVAEDIRVERQAIIDKIDQYPTLNRAGGVLLGTLDTGAEPEVWQVGTKRFWRQVMTVTIKEFATVSYAE